MLYLKDHNNQILHSAEKINGHLLQIYSEHMTCID